VSVDHKGLQLMTSNVMNDGASSKCPVRSSQRQLIIKVTYGANPKFVLSRGRKGPKSPINDTKN